MVTGARGCAPQPRSPAFINWSTHDVAWGLLTYQLSLSFPYHTRQATATSKLILRCDGLAAHRRRASAKAPNNRLFINRFSRHG
eukprot:scaffold20706_cov148-Isochrysis_galbana.AAC.1